jgi:coenzyme PQQ precursor peptide PqqA
MAVIIGGVCPRNTKGNVPMSWSTPTLVEVCIGLEINGYMPADGYVPPEF